MECTRKKYALPYTVRIMTVVTDSVLRLAAKAGQTLAIVHQIDRAGEFAADISVGPEAEVTLISFQSMTEPGKSVVKQKASIAKGGKMHWINITLGGGEVEHDLRSECTGEDAESSVDWMFYANGSEKFSLTARNVFLASNGGGEILMRGVAEQRGHVQCNGMIDIGLKGGGTNTYLTQEVLMLDKTAKVDAIPGLEIKTNDVKASHSATVSRLTDEDLFYFASRGIEENDARRMFVLGFLSAMTEKIPSEEVREKLIMAVEAKYSRR